MNRQEFISMLKTSTFYWFVDGDPYLTSLIDFPCPADELISCLEGIDRDFWVEEYEYWHIDRWYIAHWKDDPDKKWIFLGIEVE